MAVRTSFTAGEVLAAADLTDTFGAKLNLAGGKILQIVRASDSTNRATSSTSFVDVTGMSVTITPQKSNSAILIISSFFVSTSTTAATADARGGFRIADSSNNAISGAQDTAWGLINYTGSGGDKIMQGGQTHIAYATPATTSAVTYKLRFSVVGAGVTVTVINGTTTGQMYAIEVSA